MKQSTTHLLTSTSPTRGTWNTIGHHDERKRRGPFLPRIYFIRKVYEDPNTKKGFVDVANEVISIPKAYINLFTLAEWNLVREERLGVEAIIMTGLEMLERCKEINADFVTIIITGHGDHEVAAESLRVRVYDYLKKPLSLEQLVASVKKGIERLHVPVRFRL